MNKEKYVFAQLISFQNEAKFRRIVDKYQGNRYVKHFTCWNQLLALMLGQLSNSESLRDLIVALDAHHSKCYHLGIGKNVSKSSLARANQDRDYRIFEEYAYYLVNEAREKRATNIFKLGGSVYAFDSTTLCTYCSVAIVQHDMQLDRSTYEVLQVLSISLTDKTNLRNLFNKTKFQDDKERFGLNEPRLFNF